MTTTTATTEAMEARTLRPGLLVSLRTSIAGGVKYQRVDLENQCIDEDGQERSRWETTRIVVDPDEHANAVKVRGKVRALVTGVCAQSDFGLLCPNSRQGDLRARIQEARALATQFNNQAATTRINVRVVAGTIAQDDVEAVRAISGELRDLMATMETGLANMDVKAVREAAKKAKSVGQMLSADAKLRLDEAINAARAAATKVVKAGEQAAVEIDQDTLATLKAARTSFLDLDLDDTDLGAGAGDTETAAPAAPQARAMDLYSMWEDEPEPAPQTPDTPAAPELEMDDDQPEGQ
ncbi:hypothetical protein [Mycobacterium sp. TY815]|uniref:hypothetical protein n=1 Tax=Mycobacterium sp. TY815 TaxID=3050581 RepID=UPI0027421170|nr:hypothetical protein [Mycobacterium sp. TY815]MDP7706821.1 hypothetical protein [Mycobacterium sp. TY815]